MRQVHIHAIETSEHIAIGFEQWTRICCVLDAQRMVADGNIHYPVSGIASTHLSRGSADTEAGAISPDDLIDALSAREVDMRPFDQVHIEAMTQLTRDEDDQTRPMEARRLTHLFAHADEQVYRQLLYVLANGASNDGVAVTIDPDITESGDEP